MVLESWALKLVSLFIACRRRLRLLIYSNCVAAGVQCQRIASSCTARESGGGSCASAERSKSRPLQALWPVAPDLSDSVAAMTRMKVKLWMYTEAVHGPNADKRHRCQQPFLQAKLT
jgi:hypothetical protein